MQYKANLHLPSEFSQDSIPHFHRHSMISTKVAWNRDVPSNPLTMFHIFTQMSCSSIVSWTLILWWLHFFLFLARSQQIMNSAISRLEASHFLEDFGRHTVTWEPTASISKNITNTIELFCNYIHFLPIIKIGIRILGESKDVKIHIIFSEYICKG